MPKLANAMPEITVFPGQLSDTHTHTNSVTQIYRFINTDMVFVPDFCGITTAGGDASVLHACREREVNTTSRTAYEQTT